MNQEDILKDILYSYEEAGLIEGDPLKVLSLLSDDVVGIGLGDQGMVASKKDVAEIIMTTTKRDPSVSYELSYENIIVRFSSAVSANLCAKVIVQRTENGVTAASTFMQSLSFVRTLGQWYICQLHASPFQLSEESIEAYPLVFSDRTLDNLRSKIATEAFELMAASFAGGVVGVHKTGNKFPLYFANEGIARFLGYTFEEFHQVFSEDVSRIFYCEDSDFSLKLSADVLERDIDVADRIRLQKKDGRPLPVICYARKSEDSEGNDILIAVFTDVSELMELQEKLEAQNATILSSIRYAGKIQKNLLPSGSSFKQVFSDYSLIWKPRDIVGGDIYWLKTFSRGTVLCVCDCTGHGTPGALLTMLAASALDNLSDEHNCSDTAQLMVSLDRKIAEALNVHSPEHKESRSITQIQDGCDIAILFIGTDGGVTFSSAGIPVFVCNGREIKHIKGQRLHIGSGLLADKAAVQVMEIPAAPENKFYIASDGLFDQIGGDARQPLGYKAFKDIILQNHRENQDFIAGRVWEAFETHKGGHHQRDDIALVTFKP